MDIANNEARTVATGGPQDSKQTVDHVSIPKKSSSGNCAMCRKVPGEHRRHTSKRNAPFSLCGKCFDLLDKAPFAVMLAVMARIDAAFKAKGDAA